MKYDELIITSVECIQKYNQNIEGQDSHAETFLKGVNLI